jgi:hypothetical protein
MKTKVSVFAIELVLTAALATQARAQIISTGPIGIVEWNSRAVDCRIVSGAALASLTTGNVTFRPAARGTINLECQTGVAMNASVINALGLTFQNNNGFVGGTNPCTVSTSMGAYPFVGGLPLLIAAFSTSGQTFSGQQTANIPLTAFLDYNNNMYLIAVSLTRAPGATCNPVAVATFLEEVIQ